MPGRRAGDCVHDLRSLVRARMAQQRPALSCGHAWAVAYEPPLAQPWQAATGVVEHDERGVPALTADRKSLRLCAHAEPVDLEVEAAVTRMDFERELSVVRDDERWGRSAVHRERCA